MIKKLIPLLLLVPFSLTAKDYGSLVVTEVVKVYDGDTFFINIPGQLDVFGERIGIRVNGIDTPEVRTRCDKEKALGYAARDYAKALIESAEIIELRTMERGSRFRIVADVYLDNVRLADLMIEAGHAREYNGQGKRLPWC